MKTPRIIRRRRAVSPILAAILLIGLAVAAGAVLFVVVLPLISGTADVQFVSAVAADRNSDGLIDQITVQVQNKGSEKDIFSEGTISLTGWSAAGNVEIGLANPVSLVFKTTDVTAQVEETASVSITLSFDKSDDISIAETNIDMDHAASLTESDMLMDWQDGKTTRSTTTNTQIYLSDTNALHSGFTGIRMRAYQSSVDVYYYRHAAGSSDDGTSYTSGARTKTNSPETWDITAHPVISFWIKSSRDVSTDGNDRRVYLYWETWDANTPTYEDSIQLDTYMVGTSWNRVILDLSQFKNSDDGNSFGAFCIRMISGASVSNDWYVYLDDVSIHTALT
ncbi:MAG: archaellin/type IV pilin N-terminal domain-containing protein [Candidatus Hodarchaeales archaeon]